MRRLDLSRFKALALTAALAGRTSGNRSGGDDDAREEGHAVDRRPQRSQKARETWGKTHDAAVDQYGEGERAHRTAFASLKHTHEKVGDHWDHKDQKGPSDAQAARPALPPAAADRPPAGSTPRRPRPT